MLPVLQNGISRLDVRDGMLAKFQIAIMKIQPTRQMAMTMTTYVLKTESEMLQKTKESPLQLLQ